MIHDVVIYCGFLRETEVFQPIKDVGCGAGSTACLECGGSGVWDFMAPEIPSSACITCKGSGEQLVTIC